MQTIDKEKKNIRYPMTFIKQQQASEIRAAKISNPLESKRITSLSRCVCRF